MLHRLLSGMLGWVLSIHMAFAATTPIVLVHGFLGFGRDELLGPQIGFHYWGGFFDIETDLRENGYPTYTASIGPVSSNWDRACELYAQIKGGRVDYGAAHAARYGHARYGRTYPGFYPEWGQVDPATGKINKVHLIGHSQGGQTVRVLTQLLAEGDRAEQMYSHGDDLSPLFKGQPQSWIASVTTLAAPHDGTTLATGIINFGPFAENLIKMLIAVAGSSSDPKFFDFKLDQWGLKRDPNESLSHYVHRVMQSNIWTDTKDISAWDLSPEGAMALNRWVKAQSDVYYFSWSADGSFTDLIDGHHYPKWDMVLLLQPFSVFLGSYIPPAGPIKIDSTWWPNDGVVNTRSQAGPRLGSTDVIRPCSEVPQIGIWNDCGVLVGFDHISMIGLFDIHNRDPRGFFRTLAGRLANLPQN